MRGGLLGVLWGRNGRNQAWFSGPEFRAEAEDGSTVYPTWISEFSKDRYASGPFNGTVSAKTFSDLLSFLRASTATGTAALGLIVSYAVDVPRLPKNPNTGTSLGLHMEAQATNGYSFSGDVSNSTYVVPSGTKSNDLGVLSPDGVNNAGGVIHSGATGDRIARNFTYPVSSPVVMFAFINPLDNPNARPAMQLNNGTAFPGANGPTYFDLPTGTITPTAGVKGYMGKIGDWYCLIISATSSATSALTDTRVYVNTNGSTAGHRTAVWGFQTANDVYSYIPTTATPETKAADFATSSNVGSFNPTKGSIVAEFRIPYLRSGTRTVVKLDDGTSSNSMAIVVDAATRQARFVVTTSGLEQANLALGVVDEDTIQRVAINYNLNNFQGSLNGGSVVSDTLGTVPAFTTLRIGHDISSNWLNGFVLRVYAYPNTLSATELQSRSTISAPTSQLRSVVTENRVNYGTESNAATHQIVRYPVTIATDASELVINNSNMWLNTTTTGATGNAVTIVSMAIEKDGTSLSVPVTYAGQRSKTMASTDFDINSDAVPASSFGLSKFTRGEVYWVRAIFSVPTTSGRMAFTGRTNNPSGTIFGWYNPANTTITNGVDATGPVTASGTALVSRASGMAPMVLGRPLDRNAKVFIGTGTSIPYGEGDNFAYQPNNGYGYFQRAMTASDGVSGPLPSINLCRMGGRTAAYNNDWVRSYFKYANVLVDELGTNDIGTIGDGVVATIQSNLIAIYNHFKSIQFGGQVVRIYLLPRASSTDNWTTLANQTNNTGWGPGEKSQALNEWSDARLADSTIQAVVGRSAMNSPSEPYKWDVNGTANWSTYDGTHMGNRGAIIRAAELRTVLTAVQ